ncbi:MAG: hypothetical protein HFH33_01300 [Eubacterium sp.]|jgi:hypothetical protein|nr:hypothetical protein [Eubacterium sp.]
MVISINNMQRTLPQSYYVDANRIRQHLQQADKSSAANQRQGDSVDISGEGRRALKKKMSETRRMEQTGDMEKLSPVSSGASGIMNDFEKIMSELGGGSVSDEFVTKDYSQAEVDALKVRFDSKEGEKTDTFDSYVNKMAGAYQLLKDRIEKNGNTQELEMLNQAYETHSRFMATNTQIWGELQGFRAQTVYHSSDAQKETADVKEQAYHAFMSAVSEENIGLLEQEKGSLNHIRLDLGISSFERNALNGIWDYYANLKH